MGALIDGVAIGPVEGGNYQRDWENSFLSVSCRSHIGKKRNKNEDSCLIGAPADADVTRERGLLFAVADGMGGAVAGERASQAALHMLAEEYLQEQPVPPIPEALRRSVEVANSTIYSEAEHDEQYAGMGTTLSAVVIHGDCVYVAQVGDSRLYHLQGDVDMVQVTQDHSLVEEQVRSGLLTPEEARNHSLRNLITRAVGIKPSVEVDLFALRVRKGNRLLLCSDGLSNLVPDDGIAQIFAAGSTHDAADAMIEKALEEGGIDNVTVLAIEVTGTPPHEEFQEGVKTLDMPRGFFHRLRGFFS